MAARYRQALDLLRESRPKVLPGAEPELDYVIFKTESFAGYLRLLGDGAAFHPFYQVIKQVTAVENGDGQQVQDAEAQADRPQEKQEVRQAGVGETVGGAGDGHRA